MFVLKKGKTVYLRAALGYVWKAAPFWLGMVVFLAIANGILPLLPLYLMKELVDVVSTSVGEPRPDGALYQALTLIGLIACASLAGIVATILAEFSSDVLKLNVTNYILEIIHEQSIGVDLDFYENPSYFDALHRAQTEAPNRSAHVVSSLLLLVESLISLVAMSWVLFCFKWYISTLLLIAVLPDFFIRLFYSGRLFSWQVVRTPTERMASYVSSLLTEARYAKEVRLFGLGTYFADTFHGLKQVLCREKTALHGKRALASAGAQVLTTSAVFGAFTVIVYNTLTGVITLGSMVMYHQAYLIALSSLQRTLLSISRLFEDTLFLRHLFDFLELKPAIENCEDGLSVPATLEQGISIEHLSFRYPTSEHDVLRDVNLNIRRGEVLALVGENGSGKTTLSKLLCRFYDPTDGSIKIDGTDLRAFSLPSLRKAVTVVFQDYVHYHFTVRDNIWFGDITKPRHDHVVYEAARKSGAHEVIEALAEKYDTYLGNNLAKGTELSVGQWQKIALARSFLRDAQIVILDEPTSSMDPKAEYEIFRRFRELMHGRTAVLISHRFSTVRMADRIAVLNNGRLVELGSHEELLKLNGIYRSLYMQQAACYSL